MSLRALREEAGLTQQQLADAAGLAKGSISHLENGNALVSEGTAAALAEVLEVDPDELIRVQSEAVTEKVLGGLPALVASKSKGSPEREGLEVVRDLRRAIKQREDALTGRGRRLLARVQKQLARLAKKIDGEPLRFVRKGRNGVERDRHGRAVSSEDAAVDRDKFGRSNP